MAELKDSGERREFETGAVRDISEGKGRCDLLPLDVAAKFFLFEEEKSKAAIYSDEVQYLRIEFKWTSEVLLYFDQYIRTADVSCLYSILYVSSLGTMFRSPEALLIEASKQYEDGARKYSANNWRKGIFTHCYVDSGVRHFLKYLKGDRDEPHDRAFVWNVISCIWTHENLPEMRDLPHKD